MPAHHASLVRKMVRRGVRRNTSTSADLSWVTNFRSRWPWAWNSWRACAGTPAASPCRLRLEAPGGGGKITCNAQLIPVLRVNKVVLRNTRASSPHRRAGRLRPPSAPPLRRLRPEPVTTMPRVDRRGHEKLITDWVDSRRLTPRGTSAGGRARNSAPPRDRTGRIHGAARAVVKRVIPDALDPATARRIVDVLDDLAARRGTPSLRKVPRARRAGSCAGATARRPWCPGFSPGERTAVSWASSLLPAARSRGPGRPGRGGAHGAA
jgi:hypothetical protein